MGELFYTSVIMVMGTVVSVVGYWKLMYVLSKRIVHPVCEKIRKSRAMAEKLHSARKHQAFAYIDA